MQLISVLADIWLCLLLFNASLVAEARYAIVPRQDHASQSPPATSIPRDAGPTISASTTARPASKSASSPSDETASSTGPSPTEGASSTSAIDPATVTGTVLPSVPTQPKYGKLPIEPSITPALAVAGAVLMVTGLFYTLIGIKTKWLHIFLSTAYLTSLAVTVLIVYVMHSPVSNAIQGAYFVAAFVTGLIFGGGSVLFADVTEGLGCLLGGYSLAMWILVLKPDGLIKSTAGKAIFIACFTLGAFGLYMSHWTRAYGLIGATSFGGATVIVLGIDCFSRAGLKEFWLYIWGLNDDIFPLRYDGPYPHTRGIRVEIAAIILIFLVGVMSQIKVWRIIERRREGKAAEHLKKQQLQEQAEGDLGRRIEEGNARDLTTWEATYDSKNGKSRHADSGVGTEAQNVSKASLSIVGTNENTSSRAESIELDDLGPAGTGVERDPSTEGKGKGRATITVRVASEDDIVHTISRPTSTIESTKAATLRSEARSSPSIESKRLRQSPIKPSSTSASPNVVPLPFSVPVSDPDGDGGSSVAASMASERFSTRVLERLSGASLQRGSSKRSQLSYVATSTSEEALMISYNNDEDQTSSVGAAFDEASDGQRSEANTTILAGLPTPDTEKVVKSSPPTDTHPVDGPGKRTSETSLGQVTIPTQSPPAGECSAKEPQVNTSPSQGPQAATANIPAVEEDNASVEISPTQPVPEEAPAEPQEQSAERPPMRSSLAELDNASKVVMAYRTNEWAKHLDRAEKPALHEIRSLHSQQSASAASTERAAPVNVSDLRQTPLTAEPAPAVSSLKLDTGASASKPRPIDRSNSPQSQDSLPLSPLEQRTSSQSSLHSPQQRTSSQSPLPSQQQRTSSQSSLHSPQQRTSSQSSLHSPQQRTSSQSSLLSQQQRTSSQSSLSSQHQRPHQLTRQSSSHLKAQAPITIQEDQPTTTFPHRPSLHTIPTTNTLLSHRETLLQQRPSSTSLTRMPSSPLLNNNYNNDNDDDDNIPLSQRRASLLRNHANTQRRVSSSPYLSNMSNMSLINNNNNNMNNNNNNRRSSTSTTHDAQTLQLRHSQLLARKRRSEQSLLDKEREKDRKEREADGMWRHGGKGMEERHREAMRRMQAGVGK
ncbi:hypothetical protein XPA_007845 [Xanthoria parietina]